MCAAACSDSGEGRGPDALPPVTPPPPSDSGPLGDAAPDGPIRAPFGLDTRPPNSTCLAGPRPTGTTELEVIDAFPKLVGQPYSLWLVQAPGDPSRWYTVTQSGQIRSFPNNPSAADQTLVLDMPPDKVRFVSEGGLLGFAFDPQWAVNRTAYISYTQGPAGDPGVIDKSVVSRIRSTDNGATLDLATEEVLLTQAQQFVNHKGGQLTFGPDGYLYFALGDGGSANDPFGNGQNKDVLLGKILRLKVTPTGPYTIPPDNPFAAGGGRPEIFAYGLRNPWRWSFDRATGELWAGDVGQNIWEEIDIIEKGGNYGWKLREGAHCRFPTVPPCSGDGSPIDPIWEYEHDSGFTGPGSVTGGYVYRGSMYPELNGRYFFADFSNLRLYVLDRDPITNVASATQFGEGTYYASFAEDLNGEVFALDFYSGHPMRIAKKSSTQTNAFPAKLSQTGCFDPKDPKRPLPALVPYEVNAPFYSDGADKRRWLALPDGTKMTVKADGDFDFPNGAVLAKEFTLGGKRIETRLFVKHTDSEWGGYSYEWNDAETEAVLLPAGKTKPVGAVKWTYPSRGQCMSCHTPAAGRSLGLEVPQITRDATYASTNRLAPQIATLQHIGMLGDLGPAAALPALPDPYGSAAPVEARARAYLHSNCSHCHREGAPGGGNLDLRASTPFASTHTCGTAPSTGTLGLVDARVIAPGAPAQSVLLQRMRSTEAYRMPPLGRTTSDAKGEAVVESWIKGLTICPP